MMTKLCFLEDDEEDYESTIEQLNDVDEASRGQ